jgi:hypothetical protein
MRLRAGLVVELAGGRIGRDRGVDHHDLAVFLARIGFRDVGAAFAKGFHFRAGEDDADLDVVDDLVVAAGLTVLGHGLAASSRWDLPLGVLTASR